MVEILNKCISQLGSNMRNNVIHHKIFIAVPHYYCTGTETAAGPVTIVNAETTYIRVNWTRPKYSPVKIRMDYQYALLCEQHPYFTKRLYVPVYENQKVFAGMEPGSVCKLNFAVFYNPSEVDRGVNYLFETLQTSKAYYAYIFISRNA